jgi:integrase
MPDALDRKYPNAGLELGWFWVFPSQTLSIDPRVGIVRRHHLSDSVIQKAVRAAAREARIHKPVSVHTLRHFFVTHPFAAGSEADRPLLAVQSALDCTQPYFLAAEDNQPRPCRERDRGGNGCGASRGIDVAADRNARQPARRRRR